MLRTSVRLSLSCVSVFLGGRTQLTLTNYCLFFVDMRQAGSFIELLAKLSASPVNEARSVRLINFELGGNWREWELPGAVAGEAKSSRTLGDRLLTTSPLRS